jgi:acetyl esterase
MIKTKIFAALLLSALGLHAKGRPPVGTPCVYKTVEGRELKLWVVTPPNRDPAAKYPAIVFFHGGSWTKGGPEAFNDQAEYLASRGMVCVLPQYRLLTDETTPPIACIEDAQSAMRWVRSKAADLGVDPGRIAAAGGSAGGYLAAFLGLMKGFDDPQDDSTVSTKPQALVLFNPVIDNGPEGWGRGRIGNRYLEFSPAHNVKPGAPPAVIFLGTKDQVIPVKTVENFQRQMEAAGNRCDVFLYEGEKHSFFNLRRKDGAPGKFYDTLIETDRFLASLGWIQGEPTLQVPEAGK